MINDFEYGDLCPGIYRCIIDNMMNYLMEKFVAFDKKTRLLLVKAQNYKKNIEEFKDTEEIVLLFASNCKCKFEEYDTNYSVDLICKKGSVLVLRRAALLSNFEIRPEDGGSICVLIYY